MPTVLEHTGEDGSQTFVSAGFQEALDPGVYKDQNSGEEGPLPPEIAYR
jgi:hypothetical protein